MATILQVAFIVYTISDFVLSKNIHIIIRDNITQSCPHARWDLIDKDSLKMRFDMISSAHDGDHITVTAQDGQTRTISFPGCYHVSLSFHVNTPMANPYVEAFLQLGTNIPCQSDSARRIANICTNITRNNWCPESVNTKLREMLKGKKTCRFCRLCGTLKSKEDDLRKYIINEGTSECNTNKRQQMLTFKLCTPSKEQWREDNGDHEEKLQEYWNYLKQGVLTAVIHVMDRSEPSEKRLQQCAQLCSTFSSQKALSSSYRSTLLHSIEKMCAPNDTYTACIYHTMKFDVNEDSR